MYSEHLYEKGKLCFWDMKRGRSVFGTLKIMTPATLINIFTLVSALMLALIFNRASPG